MSINAPTQAGDKPVCAEPENLMLVDRAHNAKARYAHLVRERMFERQRRAQGHRHSYNHNILGVHRPVASPVVSAA